MEALSKLEDVQTFETRAGNTRFVVRDADGKEYTTFREEIGRRAQELRGRLARISFHEEQRGRFQNVYLDAVEPEPDEAVGTETDVEEAAWRTAVEAAPWLVGKPQGEVAPEELYERLKPFEERVAEDIARGRAGTDGA